MALGIAGDVDHNYRWSWIANWLNQGSTKLKINMLHMFLQFHCWLAIIIQNSFSSIGTTNNTRQHIKLLIKILHHWHRSVPVLPPSTSRISGIHIDCIWLNIYSKYSPAVNKSNAIRPTDAQFSLRALLWRTFQELPPISPWSPETCTRSPRGGIRLVKRETETFCWQTIAAHRIDSTGG